MARSTGAVHLFFAIHQFISENPWFGRLVR
jgi:hypothetical protein